MKISTKRDLSALVILLLLVLLLPISYFGGNYVRDLRSNADTSLSSSPEFYNITSNSADVVLRSNEDLVAQLRYGTDPGNLSNSAFDTRDSYYSGKMHYFRLQNLSPSTKYYLQAVFDNGFVSGLLDFNTFEAILTEPINIFGNVVNGPKDRMIRAFLIEKGTAEIVEANSLGAIVVDNSTWTLDGGNFRFNTGKKIEDLDNYLLQIELLKEAGEILSRRVISELTWSRSISIGFNQMDDPKEVAKTFENINSTNVANIKFENDDFLNKPQVVNISEGTFTMVWETENATNSYIKYTINGQDESKAYDKRGEDLKLKTHYVDIVDTKNSAGTKYELSIVNDEKESASKLSFTKIKLAEVPSPVSLNVDFNNKSEDIILLADIPGKSTKIATIPNKNEKGTLSLNSLRLVGESQRKYLYKTSESFNLQLLGDKFIDEGILERKSIKELENGILLNNSLSQEENITKPTESIPQTRNKNENANSNGKILLTIGGVIILTVTLIIVNLILRKKFLSKKITT